jgi:spore germination protein GerM
MPRKMFGVFIVIIIGSLALAAFAAAVVWRFVPPSQNPESAAAPAPAPATRTVQVYFGNANLNPGVLDCSLVFPVAREAPKTPAVGRAALEELLKGPTWAEKNAGYDTAINEGVKIRSLSVKDGVAAVDFDAKMQEGMGGSCRVSLIRSQITETLKQFPTVQSVVISVEGNSEDILQP